MERCLGLQQFRVTGMVHARGRAPIAPFCKDELKTMGRINDALIYGSEVELWGPEVPVAEVVRHCGVSAYSLLTGLKRVERKYVSTDWV